MTAAWATAAVAIASFLLGAVLPFVYNRFSHEGYSLREVPWGAFGVVAVRVTDQSVKHGMFGVIKAANGRTEPILLEDLRLDSIPGLFENSSATRIHGGLYFLDVDRNRPIVFPPAEADLHHWSTLPLLLEPQTERELALWVDVAFDDGTVQHEPLPNPKPIDLVWTISGKSRKLRVTPTADLFSLSMEVGTLTDGAEVVPVQLLPPGVAPSRVPPGRALGLSAGATLGGLDLREVDLADGHLEAATLNDVRLDGAELARVNLRKSTLNKVDLGEANLTDARLERATLNESNLRRAQMARVNLRKSALNEVDLGEADLTDARLERATLNESNLRRAQMARVNLRKSALNEVDLSEADLSAACLAGAKLTIVTLKGARMMAANLDGLVAPTVVMADANASGASLARAQLPHADLRRIDLSGADLRWADLRGATLVDADLTGAKLHGVDFSAADLSGAALPPPGRDRFHSDIHTSWPESYEQSL
jgi:uncharacterized protein YjbI with pentapeptide repeats